MSPPDSPARPVAIVTGAGRGLGRAVCRRLAGAGWDVVLVARSSDQLAAVAAELSAEGAASLMFGGDARDRTLPGRLVRAAVERFGRIDALVNNAGVYRTGEATHVDDEDWAEILDVNLTAPFRFATAVAAHLIRTGRGGSIVNIGSIFGLTGVAGTAAYAASKGGLAAVTRTLAVEWGRYGIRVNLVAPGHMRTAINADELDTDAAQTVVRRHIPLGRAAEPDEIAGLVVHLLGPDASFTTGSIMVCDGGYTAR